MTPLRQRMLEELRRRNYSPNTTRGYIHAVAQFAEYFQKSPELLGVEEIGQFQLHLLEEKKLAVGTIALRMGALRFLYKRVLRRRDLDFENLPPLKTPKKLLDRRLDAGELGIGALPWNDCGERSQGCRRRLQMQRTNPRSGSMPCPL